MLYYMENLQPEHRKSFEILFQELIAWNESFNLTTITEKNDVYIKHFLDSLTIVPHIPPMARTLLDIGSGAGFPGIPIKIVRPEINITLVEAVQKKVSFHEHIIKKLNLSGITS